MAARRVPSANLHLTLHFLGELPLSCLPALRVALGVPASAFELRFSACQQWPRGLLVAEPDNVPPALTALHTELALALAASGLRSTSPAFRPHITLARRHSGSGAAAPAPTQAQTRSRSLS